MCTLSSVACRVRERMPTAAYLESGTVDDITQGCDARGWAIACSWAVPSAAQRRSKVPARYGDAVGRGDTFSIADEARQASAKRAPFNVDTP